MAFRGPNGPTSPTGTAHSGFANYRSMGARGEKNNNNGPPAQPLDSKAIAKIHFDELNVYLASHMAKEAPGSRASAREKLTRLTRQQFQELSTDVYDELVRRKNNSTKGEVSVPFLPVRDEFHPKRNQARQKLATLPSSRFKDLSSDVFVELGRRYPELKEPETLSPMTPSVYDSEPSPSPGPTPAVPPLPTQLQHRNGGNVPRPAENVNGWGSVPTTTRQPDNFNGGYNEGGPSSSSYLNGSRDSTQGGGYGNAPSSPETARRPLSSNSYDRGRGTSYENGRTNAATTGMIIPNKSTYAEEDIKVPFGSNNEDAYEDNAYSRSRSPGGSSQGSIRGGANHNNYNDHNAGYRDQHPDDDYDRAGGRNGGAGGPMGDSSGRSPLDRLGQNSTSFSGGGLNALSSGLLNRSDDDELGGHGGGGGGRRPTDSEYYDGMSLSRGSVQSDNSSRRINGTARQSIEDVERLRRDYEFKIATMQQRIASLESSLSTANKAQDEEADRARELQDEIRSLKDSSSKQSSDLKRLQTELEDALESKDLEVQRADSDRRELARLQERIVVLEGEQHANGQNAEIEESLREEVRGLLEALRESSNRNEELQVEKEGDVLMIQNLNGQIRDLKKKYEQAKTDLRNNRPTSQLFTASPLQRADMQRLPVANNGVVADIHVSAFQSAVDHLLNEARSENQASVLMAMKPVVNSVSLIVDDVKAFEQRPTRNDVAEDTVQHLRERLEATLGNLVSAAKNHANGFGLSPVSLMDAAASHVSASIIDLVQLLQLRKATAAEREEDLRAAQSLMRSPSDSKFLSRLASLDEDRNGVNLSRSVSNTSSQLRNGFRANTATPLTGAASSFSSRSLDELASTRTETEATSIGGEASWQDTKPYVDAQSDEMFQCIQRMLGDIRQNASSNVITESLTKIITIASSVVAVSRDAMPSTSQRGTELLAEISEHCDKLSEISSKSDINKATRNTIASTSFSIAKAMKELTKV